MPCVTQAQDCQGKVLSPLKIKPFGDQGETYHYEKGTIISEVRAHRSSFFGKPSYYTSQGIGPLPAKEVELLNCHPVYHPSEGFFDPGYDLLPNDWKKGAQGDPSSQLTYQKPTPLEK
ncbi:hypothetical protein FAI40_01855 [Acetobacteraceae bacterium]|nr:hypothetical protein FAI40_01855 [Acetobacteraceae bacterium]